MRAGGLRVGERNIYYDALLRPVIELGAHSQIVQAADAYARVFAIEPAGVLTHDGSCRNEDPEALAVAATHAKVSAALRSARDAVPRTGPGVNQLWCVLSVLSSDPRTLR